MGLGRALDLVLTGRLISAEEAYQWGLVNYLVDEGKALDKAIEIAELISEYPQETLRNDRLAVYEGLGKPLSEGLIIEMNYGLRSIRTGEIYEGVKRFRDGVGSTVIYILSNLKYDWRWGDDSHKALLWEVDNL